MRKHTVKLLRWSPRWIVDRGELGFAITGGMLWKGSTKFAPHKASPDARLCQDALHIQALLPDLTVSSGVASIVGAMINTGEQSRKKSRIREDLGRNGWAAKD
jgi:hypothetical protein